MRAASKMLLLSDHADLPEGGPFVALVVFLRTP